MYSILRRMVMREMMEQGVDLNALVSASAATYYMRSGSSSVNAGIREGALLVVDCSVKPVHGSIVIAAVNGRYVMRRLLLRERPALQHLDRLNDLIDAESLEDEQEGDAAIFGVITYIINDARKKKFDDNPCI
ncbi:SOS mutagenesis and repair protein [Sodalis praecaptivus]|uniref:SOS mutagenesis and repair protein n=2 Tax=Bruguierivoracaceae TaxID=2812006 RepID=W0HVJ9_9GAMM|nr:SOS mutagenesis and repair protein [Sodalis praecaptivus]